MKLLNRKLFRDIKHNWAQFMSVFLMAMLSIIVFVGLQGAWHGLQVSLNNYLNQNQLPNYWIQSQYITNNDKNKLLATQGIKKVATGTRLQVTQNDHHLIIESYQKPITSWHQIKGAKYNSQSSNGIWLNKEYAKANSIKVGDTLPVTYNSNKVNLKVKGIIQSPNHIYFTGTQDFIAPNYSNYGYAYVSPNTLYGKLGYQEQQNIVEITGKHTNFRQVSEKIFGKRLLTYYNRQTLSDISTATDRVIEIRNLSYLFSFIFVLLAILAMYTTIQRLIKSQIGEIATFKALGFSNIQIESHYASFGLIVGVLGTIVGIIVAPLVSWFVLNSQRKMFSLPSWQISYNFSALLVMIIIVLICVFSAYFAARGGTKGLPAIYLHGTTENQGREVWLEHWHGLWKHLTYTSRWGLRDVFINRTRTLMGIVGVAGGMMLTIAGIGMPQSMNHLINKTYNNDYSYHQRVNVNNINSFKQSHPQAKQWLQVNQAHFSPDDGYNRSLIIVDRGQFVNVKTTEGKHIQDGGLYVTHGFAQRAKIHKGNHLKVKTFGSDKQYTFKVKSIVNSETNQGAYITAHTWQKAHGFYQPSILLTDKNYQHSKENTTSIVSINEQKKNAHNFINSLMSIFALIIFFGALLIIIVLYNLGSLSFIERTRDYATLRVLGIHKKELQELTLIENLITTLIGWVVGIPAGIWFLGRYVDTFSTINLEYTRYYNWQTILLSSLFVWLCSLSTTLFISRRIKNIDMVQALKGVE
ncbi:ABC transporter permease [Ligilactobacillus salivarius]|uniref:ABC transporter permease n=1 Tax=Ligilactobacillus salivarius TaxID=1624 RepID=UPI00136879F7|nr:ABC transporter permease [Ligilactobacillus salivarius]MYY39005.1 ABC transporter permease [Ligilactobacillus salivarius]